jgi:hypothetical protein
LDQLLDLSTRIQRIQSLMRNQYTKPLPLCVCCREYSLPDERIKVQCSHIFCRGCLVDLVEISLRDESLFPPRCCTKPIQVSDAEDLIGSDLVRHYEERMVEFQDPDKTYCSDPTCSKYIPPQSAKDPSSTVCKCECGKRTCRKCKQKSHGNFKSCVRHFDKMLEQMARNKGWKQCPGCSTLVELDRGCYHIR